jgi:hypothetical protein
MQSALASPLLQGSDQEGRTMMPTDGILSMAVFAPDLETALIAAFASAVVIVSGAGAAILGTLAVVDFLAGDDVSPRATAAPAGSAV